MANPTTSTANAGQLPYTDDPCCHDVYAENFVFALDPMNGVVRIEFNTHRFAHNTAQPNRVSPVARVAMPVSLARRLIEALAQVNMQQVAAGSAGGAPDKPPRKN